MAKQKTKVAPTACVIYCRVSSVEQAEEGVSLDMQERLCREHAARKGWEVVAAYRDEGISGQKDETRRPGLASVIAATERHPGSVVVVYSLSRLARTQRMTWRLLDDRGDYRLDVSSVTEPFDTSTALGKAILGMLAIWNQLEADLAGERTKAALDHIKSQGRRLGAPGMTETHTGESGGYIDSPERIEAVRYVQQLRAETGYSLRKLCDELRARGIKSTTGKAWHPRTLRKALALVLP